MAQTPQVQKFNSFKGINNKESPGTLDPSWFTSLSNCDIDDAGIIHRREGYTQELTSVIDGFSSRYGDTSFLIFGDRSLNTFDGTSTQQIYSDVGAGPYSWCEQGRDFFLSSSTKTLEIRPDNVYEWGIKEPPVPTQYTGSGTLPAGTYTYALAYLREDSDQSLPTQLTRVILSANSSIQLTNVVPKAGCYTVFYCTPPNGSTLYEVGRSTTATSFTITGDPRTWTIPLVDAFAEPPYPGSPIAAFDGRLWICETDDVGRFTRLSYSKHLEPGKFVFDVPDDDVLDVPDEVTLLAGTDGGLIVGGERSIHAIVTAEDGGYRIVKLAPYGVPSGRADWVDDVTAYFWSHRGLCKGLPFSNETEDRLRTDKGSSAAVLVKHYEGFTSILTSVASDGDIFNPPPTAATITIHSNGLLTVSNGDALLLESGDYLLLESGDYLFLEA